MPRPHWCICEGRWKCKTTWQPSHSATIVTSLEHLIVTTVWIVSHLSVPLMIFLWRPTIPWLSNPATLLMSSASFLAWPSKSSLNCESTYVIHQLLLRNSLICIWTEFNKIKHWQAFFIKNISHGDGGYQNAEHTCWQTSTCWNLLPSVLL